MYEGCSVELKMIHMFLEGEDEDRHIYPCRVIGYDKEKECLNLTLEEGDITCISLDAEYDCRILAGEPVSCQGRVSERFIDKNGKQLIFCIENGFYKNNLN